jgi:hypothetical protein
MNNESVAVDSVTTETQDTASEAVSASSAIHNPVFGADLEVNFPQTDKDQSDAPQRRQPKVRNNPQHQKRERQNDLPERSSQQLKEERSEERKEKPVQKNENRQPKQRKPRLVDNRLKDIAEVVTANMRCDGCKSWYDFAGDRSTIFVDFSCHNGTGRLIFDDLDITTLKFYEAYAKVSSDLDETSDRNYSIDDLPQIITDRLRVNIHEVMKSDRAEGNPVKIGALSSVGRHIISTILEPHPHHSKFAQDIISTVPTWVGLDGAAEDAIFSLYLISRYMPIAHNTPVRGERTRKEGQEEYRSLRFDEAPSINLFTMAKYFKLRDNSWAYPSVPKERDDHADRLVGIFRQLFHEKVATIHIGWVVMLSSIYNRINREHTAHIENAKKQQSVSIGAIGEVASFVKR